MTEKILLRFAAPSDTPLILNFIKKLAEYENMLDCVTATEKALYDWIFDKKKAEVIFAVLGGKEIGFALYFNNFSTFRAKAGIFIEDLFVLEEYRGKGCGKAIFKKLAQIARERNYGAIEWRCLTWNENAIKFYTSLGAKQLEEWDIYQLPADKVKKLASE